MNRKMSYAEYQEAEFRRFESVCKRCGECCGSRDGDPCRNLALGSDMKYYCRKYEDRLGPQMTLSGKVFNCVPIREITRQGMERPNCAYNKGG